MCTVCRCRRRQRSPTYPHLVARVVVSLHCSSLRSSATSLYPACTRGSHKPAGCSKALEGCARLSHPQREPPASRAAPSPKVRVRVSVSVRILSESHPPLELLCLQRVLSSTGPPAVAKAWRVGSWDEYALSTTHRHLSTPCALPTGALPTRVASVLHCRATSLWWRPRRPPIEVRAAAGPHVLARRVACGGANRRVAHRPLL